MTSVTVSRLTRYLFLFRHWLSVMVSWLTFSCFDVMVSRYHSVVVSQCHEFTLSWLGVMLSRLKLSWLRITVLRCHGIVELWCHSIKTYLVLFRQLCHGGITYIMTLCHVVMITPVLFRQLCHGVKTYLVQTLRHGVTKSWCQEVTVSRCHGVTTSWYYSVTVSRLTLSCLDNTLDIAATYLPLPSLNHTQNTLQRKFDQYFTADRCTHC